VVAVRCHFGVSDPVMHFVNKYPDKIRGSIEVNVALRVKICCVIRCDPFFEMMNSVLWVWL